MVNGLVESRILERVLSPESRYIQRLKAMQAVTVDSVFSEIDLSTVKSVDYGHDRYVISCKDGSNYLIFNDIPL